MSEIKIVSYVHVSVDVFVTNITSCLIMGHRSRASNCCTVKVKVKFTLEQATKAERGSRGIALLFL